LNEDKEKLENCKGLIRFFLKQSSEYLEQARFHCGLIYPNWQKIEEKIIETQLSIAEILKESEMKH
jgi:hypothetical protein